MEGNVQISDKHSLLYMIGNLEELSGVGLWCHGVRKTMCSVLARFYNQKIGERANK